MHTSADGRVSAAMLNDLIGYDFSKRSVSIRHTLWYTSFMEKVFNWNDEKNIKLIEVRDVSFEEVVFCIQNHQVLDIVNHPNPSKYPHQKIFVVLMNDYVYLVPFVETKKEVFLKIIIPSRKARKKYLGGSNEP
jgi:uncharacterized DUF497 family protein